VCCGFWSQRIGPRARGVGHRDAPGARSRRDRGRGGRGTLDTPTGSRGGDGLARSTAARIRARDVQRDCTRGDRARSLHQPGGCPAPRTRCACRAAGFSWRPGFDLHARARPQPYPDPDRRCADERSDQQPRGILRLVDPRSGGCGADRDQPRADFRSARFRCDRGRREHHHANRARRPGISRRWKRWTLGGLSRFRGGARTGRHRRSIAGRRVGRRGGSTGRSGVPRRQPQGGCRGEAAGRSGASEHASLRRLR